MFLCFRISIEQDAVASTDKTMKKTGQYSNEYYWRTRAGISRSDTARDLT